MRLMEAHSWLPLNRKKFSGYLICARVLQQCRAAAEGRAREPRVLRPLSALRLHACPTQPQPNRSQA